MRLDLALVALPLFLSAQLAFAADDISGVDFDGTTGKSKSIVSGLITNDTAATTMPLKMRFAALREKGSAIHGLIVRAFPANSARTAMDVFEPGDNIVASAACRARIRGHGTSACGSKSRKRPAITTLPEGPRS